MACRRCSFCSINYPVRGHDKCDGCGGKTSLVSNASPSETWREEAATVRAGIEEGARAVAPHPQLGIKLHVRDGQFFISSLDVINAGLRHQLIPDTLVEVLQDDKSLFFEVGGYSYDRREYWLVPVKEPEEDVASTNDFRVRPLELPRGGDDLI